MNSVNSIPTVVTVPTTLYDRVFENWKTWVIRQQECLNYHHLKFFLEGSVYTDFADTLDVPKDQAYPVIHRSHLHAQIQTIHVCIEKDNPDTVYFDIAIYLYQRYKRHLRQCLNSIYRRSLGLLSSSPTENRAEQFLVTNSRYMVDKYVYRHEFPERIRNLLEMKRLKMNLSEFQSSSEKFFLRSLDADEIIRALGKPPSEKELMAD